VPYVLDAKTVWRAPRTAQTDPRGDPGRTEPDRDLSRTQVGRNHRIERGDVRLPPLVAGVLGRGAGLGQLDPDVAGQVLRGQHQRAGLGRVGEHQPGQPGESVVLRLAEQPGDLGQVDPAVGVQADRQRVLGGVRAQPRGAGGDDPLGEDAGRLGGVQLLGIQLERVDGRGVRVGAESALAGPDPGHLGLPGVRVGAAGRAVADPVDRPEPRDVVAVAGVQLRPQPGDLDRVVQRGRLGRE